jgi:3-hydroxy-9,10-secoandrosta-1,3,5(10)-triene-9,17-dione monooxygenase reductase component
MIDRTIKRCLGQMMKGVEVVGARHAGVARAYTSHWVTQVSFDEPIVMASVSPKHDTYPLMVASGEFSVSVLAAEYVTEWPGDPDGPPVVPNSIAWLRCSIFEQRTMRDHELMFATVDDVVEGRLKEPPLLYSSRLGWRATGDKAREPGVSIRDALLERLAALGLDDEPD